MKLRYAQPTHTDALAIARVQVRGWQAAYRGLLSDEYLGGLSIEKRTHRWLQILADDPVLLAADDTDQVVAFCAFGDSNDDDADEHTGAIHALYALPTVWGKGYGHALLVASIERLRQDGFHTITLWVLAGNTRAISFYERHGFQLDGHTQTETISPHVTFHEQRMKLSPFR